MHFQHSLQRYWQLLAHYLRPQRMGIFLLTLILCCSISVQISTPLVASRFIDQALLGATLNELVFLALLTLGLALLSQGLAIAETYVAEQLSWTATNELRADLLAHLLGLDATFHTAHSPGELIERTDGDVATLARFFSRFVVYVLGNSILIFGILGLLIVVDWRVGLGLSSFVVIAFVLMLRIRASATPLWAAERQASADYYGFLSEYLSGMEDIRSSGATAFVLRRCAEVMRSWFAAIYKAQLRGYALVASSQGLFGLGTVVAFGLSAMLFRESALTIGTVYLIFRYTDMLRQPAEQIRNEIQDLQQADASIGRIEALLQTPSELVDGPVTELPAGPLSVDLDHVSFGYNPHDPVLRNLNLRLEPGRVLGIVGRTGSGKTSLIRLLLRFYDPQQGMLRLNGIDLSTVQLEALRSRIGLVTQDVHIFNASLYDNLTLFDPGIAEQHILEVLHNLGLAEWLAEQPQGLDTILGAHGIGLSAGQSQLLACGRIFLRNPDLVILDEASSRLDLVSERRLHIAIGRLLKGRTGIIVAHRLDTVAYADDILVLQDGQIQEYGPRESLANDPKSHFAGLLRIGLT